MVGSKSVLIVCKMLHNITVEHKPWWDLSQTEISLSNTKKFQLQVPDV
jgi:hypothetical protein